jgi:glycosyltransferase involved in cell wall biosynthesis
LTGRTHSSITFLMLLSIVIPAYNEERFLPEVIRRVKEAPYDKEIIVVDDASVDGTRKCLQGLNDAGGIKVVFHEKNAGKGAAVRSAIKIASGDIIVIQDADLEYDPKDYPKLLEPILEGNADVVYGSRFLGGPHRVFYFRHYVGNQIVTLLSNILSDLNLSDVETGYKAFARKVFDGITIESNRFGFEPEITAKVAKKGYRVYEVPVSYHGRSYNEGKKITWKDGVKALFTIVKYNLFR